jgi:hypothetical protein
MALLGSSGHVVPMLTDRGLSPTAATATFGLVGLSTLTGRVVAGFLVDRIFAPYVAAVFWLAPVAGFALLAGFTGLLPAAGVVLIGLGLGAEVDMIAFLITRYLGQRAFGVSVAARPHGLPGRFVMTLAHDDGPRHDRGGA